jgi:acyl transferase domain-containing protein/aryl carrier-like protein
VKSNIGHCLTAAGVASLIKVLQALKHRQLPPSMHFERLNEHIALEGSPFYVSSQLQAWNVEPEVRRRGAISSFGFSGTNAHLVIAEYVAPVRANASAVSGSRPFNAIVPLSARTPEQLRDRARDLLSWVENTADLDLASLACTLQLGREPMEERVGFVVSSIDELAQRLRAYVAGEQAIPGCHQGQVKRNREGLSLISQDAELLATIVRKWLADQKLAKLLELWVKGVALDWNALYGAMKPRRVRLPTYPFAKERYWIDAPARLAAFASGGDESANEHVGPDETFSDALEPAQRGVVQAEPVWEAERAAPGPAREFSERHVWLYGVEAADVVQLQRSLTATHCEQLTSASGASLAERYSGCVVECFERIQCLLRSKPAGSVLLQVVIDEALESSVFGGLSGLLKTTSLENPRFVCQLIRVNAAVAGAELVQRLQEESSGGACVIRYGAGVREVQRWRVQRSIEHEDSPRLRHGWKDDGVYLITGGLGGLGKLFAREILEHTSQAKVILTGRSALNDTRGAELARLHWDAARFEYRVMDVSNAQQVRAQLEEVYRHYGALHGIVHAAGVIADNFIVKKTRAELQEVLAAKVAGTVNLDEASAAMALDFVVLFSSVAAALGNVGQSDYAAANGFMDEYARYRNARVARGERHGKTVSINWPLWADGGMSIDAASAAQLEELTGMRPMRTSAGLAAFHDMLQSGSTQRLVMEGEIEKLQRTLEAGSAVQAPSTPSAAPNPPVEMDARSLRDSLLRKLQRLVGEVFQLAPERIDVQEELSAYGLDSIIVTKLNQKLAQAFAEMPKTLFFEHKTLESLASYLIPRFPTQCLSWIGAQPPRSATSSASPQSLSTVKRATTRSSPPRRALTKDTSLRGSEPIAIIGLSGLYPQAATLRDYWNNLKAGKDCIGEIPARRWPLDGFYHPNEAEAVRQGKSYSKWGAFVEQFDQFDALFFGISPRDAINLDPQERLFLQAAWHALEDSGYTRFDLQQRFARRVGVFAGITKTGFNLHGRRSARATDHFRPHTSFSSVANRLSYFLDITGPSMPIDTMCSSSLTAIHEACEHIHRGDCDLAFAGGVNLYLHPTTYTDMSTQYVLSRDGVCRSFGAGANGFVPGEGVGAVLLKPLSAAVADQDVIHGLVLATHVNHGGKTNGYTVPSPRAQAELVRRAIEKAGISARDISYIEAHGTGTELGDPIEIEGLQQAFQHDTPELGFCRIGSAKSSIGHLEAAAGIAGLTKVLLQMKHREIAPSLHAEQVNPNIPFERTPFVLNRTLTPWPGMGADGRAAPRIAGISSFGAGGANAHVIVKEYDEPLQAQHLAADYAPRAAIPLSARTPAQLRQKARELLAFMHAEGLTMPRAIETRASARAPTLIELAYTLQVGREGMEHRVGFVVSSFEELEGKLHAYVSGERGIEDAWEGHVKGVNDDLAWISEDEDMQAALENWIASEKLSRMLELWVRGLKLDWHRLYSEARPRRVSLPVYPFADDRYWLPAEAPVREREVKLEVVRNLASVEKLIEQIDAERPTEMLNAS